MDGWMDGFFVRHSRFQCECDRLQPLNYTTIYYSRQRMALKTSKKRDPDRSVLDR